MELCPGVQVGAGLREEKRLCEDSYKPASYKKITDEERVSKGQILLLSIDCPFLKVLRLSISQSFGILLLSVGVVGPDVTLHHKKCFKFVRCFPSHAFIIVCFSKFHNFAAVG